MVSRDSLKRTNQLSRMEVIDWLLFFWLALVVGIYVIGTIYERQVRVQCQKKVKSEQRKSSEWPPREQLERRATSEQEFYSSHYDQAARSTLYDQPANQGFNDLYSTQPSYQLNSEHLQHQQLSSSLSPGSQQYETQFNAYTESSPVEVHEQNADISSIPTATGFNSECVQWVNSILYLFYTQPGKYAPILAESVCRSLNEKLASLLSSNSSTDYGQLEVEFCGYNQELSSRPELTNIRTETESDKSVSVVCKIYNQRLVFDLNIKQAQSSLNAMSDFNLRNRYDESGNYQLTLENLEGKLKSIAILNDKLIVVQFLEKPDTKIQLRPKRFQSIQQLNEDSLVSLIMQTLTQVVIDLYFGNDVDFPHYKHQSSYKNKLNMLKGSANEIKSKLKHDFFGAISNDNKERKVLIKILAAKNINYNQNVTCILELDNPYQQALSSTKQGSNPFWDEHFLFNLSEKSNELQFELWDSLKTAEQQTSTRRLSSASQMQSRKWNKTEIVSGAKFLGLARVSIDEVVRQNSGQKVTLMLQSRASSQNIVSPMAITTDLSSSVGGELQVELLCIEHSADLKKSGSSNSLLTGVQQGDLVSVDRKLTPSGYVITTTTITKPAKTGTSKARYDQLSVRNQSPVSSQNTEHSELDLDAISSQLNDNQSNCQQVDSQSRGGRSRSRSRSRSFLRAIKKRLSFSRTRSRSVGESGAAESRSGAQSAMTSNLDAISIDARSRASSDASYMGRAKSVPASRDLGEVPMIVINKSRLSDTASALNFLHPKSQLVIECKEAKLSSSGVNAQKVQLRHYAIADELARNSKWSKKGTKLHVFNEHQFVATHLAGSSTCHLCGRVFSRRPGKQGYKCRNCHLLSHKECHVKVEHNCPYASKNGLKLEYIDADPPASLMSSNSVSSSSSTLPRVNRQPKLSAKSISMEVEDR